MKFIESYNGEDKDCGPEIRHEDKAKSRQCYQYGLTSSQLDDLNHYSNMFGRLSDAINTLVNGEERDPTYIGFELGRIYENLQDQQLQMMELINLIVRQADVY
jgi:hypothetical protein